jgi:hypothetical protein
MRNMVVVGLTVLGATTAQAQVCSWQTVDDFVPNAAIAPLGASAGEVFESQAGLRVAGIGIVSPTETRWITRRLTNAGVWSTVDDLFSPGVRTHPEAIHRTSAGDLFVVGGENDASNVGNWLVRQAVNNPGTSWSTSDVFEGSDPAAGFAHAVVDDNQDRVFVGGYATIAPDTNTYHWVVRRSDDAGLTWSIDDDVSPIVGAAAVTGLGHRGGTVYAAGYNYDGYQYHWQVRRRSAGATTWDLVDDFLPRASPTDLQYGAIPTEIIAPRGQIVVAGGGTVDDAGLNRWVVRRSADRGTSWQETDNVGPVCHLRGLAYDATSSLLYASGRCRDVGGAYRWLTRVSTDDGLTWADDDNFELTPGLSSIANGVHARGPTGTFAVGVGDDAAGVRHWIVRQRLCVAAAPVQARIAPRIGAIRDGGVKIVKAPK